MGKKNLIYLVMFLIVLPFVSSVQPSNFNINTNYGLQIEAPLQDALRFNESYTFHIHTYNLSDGTPLTSGLSCYMHLYNNSGNHILTMQDNAVEHDFDYAFKVTGGNLTRIGVYNVLYQCNGTGVGGFYKTKFYVTQQGNLPTSDVTLLGLLLLFMFLFGFMIYSMFSMFNNLAKVGIGLSDISMMLIGYFNILIYYQFALTYLSNNFVNQMTLLLIQIGAFTHVIIPLTIWIISFFLINKKRGAYENIKF